MQKNSCEQAVYQLKACHVTNCLISKYPSTVVLSLMFCLFWEVNSELCINCHQKCLPAASRVSIHFTGRKLEVKKKRRKSKILVVPNKHCLTIESGRNFSLQFIGSSCVMKQTICGFNIIINFLHQRRHTACTRYLSGE